MGEVIELPTQPDKKPSRRRMKAAEDVRDQRFHILISANERAKLEARADELGVTVADVLRMSFLGPSGARRDPTVTQIVSALAPSLAQIGRMTQNLNQIAHHLNLLPLMKQPIDKVQVTDDLAAVLLEIRSIRGELSASLKLASKLVG